jgi:hypothetical protein
MRRRIAATCTGVVIATYLYRTCTGMYNSERPTPRAGAFGTTVSKAAAVLPLLTTRRALDLHNRRTLQFTDRYS